MDINSGYSNPMGFMPNPYQQSMPYNNPYANNRAQSNNKIIWASEEEAKAFPLTPNSNVSILDRDKNILYLKSCDSMGMCTFKKFAITELEEPKAANVPEPDMSAYVRRDEFEELKQLINNMGGGTNEKSVSANNGRSSKRSNNGDGDTNSEN